MPPMIPPLIPENHLGGKVTISADLPHRHFYQTTQSEDGSRVDGAGHVSIDRGVIRLLMPGTTDDYSFIGTTGNDSIIGTTGADFIIGHAGADHIDGGAGVDTASYAGSPAPTGVAGSNGVHINLSTGRGYNGDAEGDRLYNVENIIGSSHNDLIIGDDGSNMLDGGAGHDFITGGRGDDLLFGGQGNDFLSGGQGRDILEGGAGRDVFQILDHRQNFASGGMSAMIADADKVRDFTAGTDRLEVSGLATHVVQHSGTDADGTQGSLVLIVGTSGLINYVFLEGYTEPLTQRDMVNPNILVHAPDSPPEFQDAAGNRITSQLVSVNENVEGAVLATFNVVDAEGDGPVRYRIASEQHSFMIEDGQLRLRPGTSLDYEALTDGRIMVEVTATTQRAGETAKYARLLVTVDVGDVDETPAETPFDLTAVHLQTSQQDITAIKQMATVVDGFDGTYGQLRLADGVSEIWHRTIADPLATNGESTLITAFDVNADTEVHYAVLRGWTGTISANHLTNQDILVRKSILHMGDEGPIATNVDHHIDGDDLANFLSGNSGNDRLYGRGDADWMLGFGGNDLLYGGGGDDTMLGGADNDLLHGEGGDDRLYGGDGYDWLFGGADQDLLVGGSGEDWLIGGIGDDQLLGEGGRDTLIGGAGRDRFHVSDPVTSLDRADVVTDFTQGEDKIVIGNSSRKQVWAKREDADDDGDNGTVLYNNAEGTADNENGGVYAILLNYTGTLEALDFVDGRGESINGFTVHEII